LGKSGRVDQYMPNGNTTRSCRRKKAEPEREKNVGDGWTVLMAGDATSFQDEYIIKSFGMNISAR